MAKAQINSYTKFKKAYNKKLQKKKEEKALVWLIRYTAIVFIIAFLLGIIIPTVTAVDMSYTPQEDKIIYAIPSPETKISPREEIVIPKVIKDTPKKKTLAREAKNSTVDKVSIARSGGRFASTQEELSNIPANQESCFDHIPEMAQKYGVDADLMTRIVKAESGGNPLAKNKNSTASGCSQWIRSSWAGVLRQMGREWDTPFNGKLNIEAMAWKIANGGISAWNASKHKWSK